MSLHFYRGPKDRRRKPTNVVGDDHCARFLEQAEASKSWIPAQLSFEEIVKNNTLPVRIPSSGTRGVCEGS